MPDKFSKEVRSRIMSRIRSKNTSPEVTFRKLLWKNGLKGYRIHYKVIGNPDVAYVSKKIAIFIDGDFWHGYNWKKRRKVPPNDYWKKKIEKNMKRDKKYNGQLKKEGWKVLRFWEHEVMEKPDKCLKKIKKVLRF